MELYLIVSKVILLFCCWSWSFKYGDLQESGSRYCSAWMTLLVFFSCFLKAVGEIEMTFCVCVYVFVCVCPKTVHSRIRMTGNSRHIFIVYAPVSRPPAPAWCKYWTAGALFHLVGPCVRRPVHHRICECSHVWMSMHTVLNLHRLRIHSLIKYSPVTAGSQLVPAVLHTHYWLLVYSVKIKIKIPPMLEYNLYCKSVFTLTRLILGICAHRVKNHPNNYSCIIIFHVYFGMMLQNKNESQHCKCRCV